MLEDSGHQFLYRLWAPDSMMDCMWHFCTHKSRSLEAFTPSPSLYYIDNLDLDILVTGIHITFKLSMHWNFTGRGLIYKKMSRIIHRTAGYWQINIAALKAWIFTHDSFRNDSWAYSLSSTFRGKLTHFNFTVNIPGQSKLIKIDRWLIDTTKCQFTLLNLDRC